MELMGEYCSNAPCKWLLDLGKGAAHDTDTHNLFDGMPSQSEMPKENQRISKPVPINSTVNKKEKWLDKALDRILEKSKVSEEMIAAIRAITVILKGASSPTPMAPPLPVHTNCLMECPNDSSSSTISRSIYINEGTAPTVILEHEDGEGKDHMPFIVIKDLPEFTPTMCSMICSSSDTKPDLTVAVVVTCATSVESSMEMVATGSTTDDTHIDTLDSTKVMPASCSTVGLDVKGGADHTRVTCRTMMGVPEGVLVPDASSKVFSPWLMAEMDLIPLLPTGCSMKCPKDKKLLMGNAKRNSWPPSWLGGVIRRWELQPLHWPGSKLYLEGLPLMPPWPPPAGVSFLAWEPFDIGVLVIGTVILTQEMAGLKPWPPPSLVSSLAWGMEGREVYGLAMQGHHMNSQSMELARIISKELARIMKERQLSNKELQCIFEGASPGKMCINPKALIHDGSLRSLLSKLQVHSIPNALSFTKQEHIKSLSLSQCSDIMVRFDLTWNLEVHLDSGGVLLQFLNAAALLYHRRVAQGYRRTLKLSICESISMLQVIKSIAANLIWDVEARNRLVVKKQDEDFSGNHWASFQTKMPKGLKVPWDPRGFFHWLGDKPNFKKRGLSGPLLGCTMGSHVGVRDPRVVVRPRDLAPDGEPGVVPQVDMGEVRPGLVRLGHGSVRDTE
uniref:Uncharacterized protein n=1 Tax=Oryza sativa subsp. japonica TaxID=39947 RepID=Q5Z586_ORYSJ|nr:hypothetical protein [Oryza sativa Japonica Group]BAD69395.1 hypothetical protein [Oryza sativa Japonica Group]